MEPADLIPRRVAAVYLTVPWVLGTLIAANSLAFLVGIRYYLDTMGPIPTWQWPLYGDSPTAVALATLVFAGLLPLVGRATDDPRRGDTRASADASDTAAADASAMSAGDASDTTSADASDTSAGDTPWVTPALLAPRRWGDVSAVYGLVSTLAVVWLIETGLWTLVALNVPLVRPDLPVDLYLGFGPGSLWAYWGILVTHAAFLLEAALLAHVARTSRRVIGVALVGVLANDLFDYGFLVGLETANYPPLRYEPGVILAVCSVGTSLVAVALAWRLLPSIE